jgi:hypothetical protein
MSWRQENHKFEASQDKVSEALAQRGNKNERAGGVA